MTDSTRDWADEEACNLMWKINLCDEDGALRLSKDDIGPVAAALRSARAQGMREAAEIATYREAICEDAMFEIDAGRLYRGIKTARISENCARLEAGHISDLIRTRADAIERGE